MADQRIPAAQYLRMSTEHQRYSPENQAAAIQKYAETHGFTIVRTFPDDARSGLVLKNRLGLRSLIQEVATGTPCFRAILVYDVSRWGRFQDVDESAHYEFLCRSAGAPVHYCAETFQNDGALPNTLLKAIKRSMAAEYSRELGVKILSGQRNIYQRGFRGSGGMPGYGLRRMLVSPDGAPKQLLAFGERKALMTDRVVLVPGPENEVRCVQEIYDLFVRQKYSYARIAELLNSRSIPYQNERRWNLHAVHQILTSPKYHGILMYGRVSRRLQTKEVKMPESEWLTVPHPSSRVIDDATFTTAGERIASFTINKSDEQILGELSAILAVHGRLNSTLIRQTAGATPPTSYRYRFGSLMRAYELIGYKGPIAQLVTTRRRIQGLRQQLMEQLQDLFPSDVRICSKGGRTRSWLRLKNGVKISVRVCMRYGAKPAWLMRPVAGESRWTTLVALLNSDNTQFADFLVFPAAPARGRYISENSAWLEEGSKLNSLKEFYRAVNEVRKKRRY